MSRLANLRSIARRIVGVAPSALADLSVPGDADGDGYTQAELLHLQFLQDVIARLSNYGSLIKGWSITFAGVMFGLAVTGSNPGIAIVVVPATLLFWALDAYFLWSERCYRRLFDDVRRKRTEPFFMSATARTYLDQAGASEDQSGYDLRWRSAMWRPTLRLLYGCTLLATTLLALVLWLPTVVVPTVPWQVPGPSSESPSPKTSPPVSPTIPSSQRPAAPSTADPSN